MKRLAFCILSHALASGIVSTSYATSSQHEINGFRYQTCTENGHCIEVSAPKAWLSQLNGGFTTSVGSKVTLRDQSGKVLQEWPSNEVTLHMRLNQITISLESSGLVTVSTTNGNAEVFDPNVRAKEKHK